MWIKSLVLIAALLFLCAQATNNILVLGDSWAEYAGTDILEGICPNSKVVNIGDDGSPAFAWAQSVESRLNDVPQDFSPDYAWISLGAWDYVFSQCRPQGGPAGIANSLRSVMAVLSSRYPGIQFLMTGYGLPSAEGTPCGAGPETYLDFRSVFTDFAFENTTVALIDELFGGTLNETYIGLSESQYYADFVHLNELGYKLLFEHPPVFDGLGCGVVTTDSPTASPTQSDACFSGESIVMVQGRGHVKMSDLTLGDMVQVAGYKYEPIYSFGHYKAETWATFLQIHVKEDDNWMIDGPLELTSAHLVLTDMNGFVPASSIKVGDSIMMASFGSTSSSLTAAIVVNSINKVTRKGVFAPFTKSGTIVVNGIIASSFVAFQNSATLKIGTFDTGVPYQYMAHAFEGPHRFYCTYVLSCANETYDAEGISTWVAGPREFYLWFLAQHQAVMLVLAVPILLVLAAFARPVATCTVLVLAILGRRQALGMRKSQGTC